MRISIVILAAAALASCGRNEPAKVEAGTAAPASVATTAVSLTGFPAVYQATGTVRARTAATIASKVMGYVQQVNVTVGSRVQAGQLLVALDARDLEANLRRAEEGCAEAKNAVPEAENGVAAAQANLDLAKVTFRRIEDLAAKKSISEQEFDEAAARRKAAQAAYEMAVSRRAQLQSRIAQAEQEQRAARITLNYAQIRAPFAGVVTAKSVDPGNLAAPGAPLLTVEQQGGYRLEVAVDESKLPALRTGQSARVTLDALGRSLEARVSEIVPEVDAASRTYTAKIDLPPLGELRSGMFGKAEFSMGARQALAIPASALRERGQLQSVFVVDNGAAHTRLVTTGQKFGDAVEVLSGLNAGEKVVVRPPAELADGAPVEARP
ncbi:MAG TPA: efflux RND transporter periplasmic adaptor subunit [Bryobacteraceae bacterium]|nr:efflux RND transporter periplasmic adaptor subunit [Bryobacteraceae bacterium]